MKVDFIGDIHGHADELIELLTSKLQYNNSKGYYSHPEDRKIIFVGDFIDKGPKIRETLQIVKAMCENGSAQAVIGNHEYNAILFHTPNKKEGGYYREHSFNEINHHYETLKQFKDYPQEWMEYLNWFKTLPFFIETNHYRVVHAYWNDEYIKKLKEITKIWDEKFLDLVTNKESEAYQIIEDLLKGPEFELPTGDEFKDKYGKERNKSRIKWWETNFKKTTYGSHLLNYPYHKQDHEFKLNLTEISFHTPVFFGHYWLTGDIYPNLILEAICLDYSVADKGKLVSFSLDTKNYNFIESIIKVS
jgi:hypothetical protein